MTIKEYYDNLSEEDKFIFDNFSEEEKKNWLDGIIFEEVPEEKVVTPESKIENLTEEKDVHDNNEVEGTEKNTKLSKHDIWSAKRKIAKRNGGMI